MKLVVVESPNKCDTISHYLGNGYKVMATKGHICDLAKKGKGGFGIDAENGFKAKYEIDSAKYNRHAWRIPCNMLCIHRCHRPR